ncbi:MAG: hypothetical protein CBC25_07175 [Pelagibacteraceae bacterium TMED65]|nr:MAG: hypothetical protein CBC25_07175 [Pelagibacteraceae bacterium TMED65]
MKSNLRIKKFIKKLQTTKFSVGVIGLGYVGLPICARFVKANIKVYGLDNDKKKINQLKKGISYIKNNNLKNFNYFKYNKSQVGSDYKILNKCDAILICLPTPLKNLKPDMSYVFNCSKKIKKILKPYQILILESTVYPGATDKVLEIVKNKSLEVGKNFFCGYSPERENPGDSSFSYKKTPKVVSGVTKNCELIIQKIYSPIVKKVVMAKSIKDAELSKLLENMYRAVNIGLVNELKIICDKLKIDIFNVIDLASTKNFGFQKFLPGPGLGGHCIPIDPYYLSWISRKNGYEPKFISVAGKINRSIPKWIVKKMLSKLKSKKLKVLILGVSYKKNIEDDRESPSFNIMKILKSKNIKFEYNDPFFKKLRKSREFNFKKKSIFINKKNLKKFDAVLLVTDHDFYNYKFIAENSKIIFDTRGIYKRYNFKNIVYC